MDATITFSNSIFSNPIPQNIRFTRMDGTVIGTLDFSGPKMVFTGEAEDSAMVFFDHIARLFSARLLAEREAGRDEAPATNGALV